MSSRELAQRLREARRTAQPIPQLTSEFPALTVEEAYEIQRELVASALPVGHKMGLTSVAKQREVGVSTPIRGRLLGADAIGNGGITSHRRFIHPRAEPEVVFLLNRELPAGASTADIRAAIASVHVGIEIIDSRYQNFKFTLPDVVADNTSAAGYVLGEAVVWPIDDLQKLEVWIAKNGVVVHRATADAILGHPLKSLDELVRLSPEGVKAEPGLLPGSPISIPVLAGAVTSSITFEAGDSIEVSCTTGARASFRVV